MFSARLPDVGRSTDQVRCRANIAHLRQPRPDSGPGVQAKAPEMFEVLTLCLDAALLSPIVFCPLRCYPQLFLKCVLQLPFSACTEAECWSARLALEAHRIFCNNVHEMPTAWNVRPGLMKGCWHLVTNRGRLLPTVMKIHQY